MENRDRDIIIQLVTEKTRKGLLCYKLAVWDEVGTFLK